jgi:hypothetical protein
VGWKRFLFVPMAGDLERNEDDQVVVGSRTAQACIRTIALAHYVPRPQVLFTAAQAGEEYDYALMGMVMEHYTNDRAPCLPTMRRVAHEFSSFGEIFAAAKFVAERGGFERVVFVCETWRKRRIEMIAHTVFEALDLSVEIEIETFRTHESFWKTEIVWRVYEWAAYRDNKKRITQELPTLVKTVAIPVQEIA